MTTRQEVIDFLSQLQMNDIETLLSEVKSIDEGFPDGLRLDSMPVPIYGAEFPVAYGCLSTVTYNEWGHDVHLVRAGSSRALTMKVIRECVKVSPKFAAEVVDNLPWTIVTGVSREEAKEVRDRFAAIGALVGVYLTKSGTVVNV
jgi:ribosomal protein L7/L12